MNEAKRRNKVYGRQNDRKLKLEMNAHFMKAIAQIQSGEIINWPATLLSYRMHLMNEISLCRSCEYEYVPIRVCVET